VSNSKPKVIFLVGATATGKTEVSVELAKKFPIEIINADSLQVFRHMDIGTAKPSVEVQKKIPHHLIDILNPDEEFTAKEYSRLAMQKIQEVSSRKKIPLFVGGAGFYLKTLSNPVEELPAGRVEISDLKKAYAELMKKDPIAAQKIHANDEYRISRALFLLENGIIPSEAYQSESDEDLPLDITWIGISCERSEMRTRIQQRVEKMYAAGLVDETAAVLEKFPVSRPRLDKTIGYREALDVLFNKLPLEEALVQTTIQTNQYAKRQDTWFRKNPSIMWSPLPKAVDAFSFSIQSMNQV
jgi:tRNA dimethylallyltransferase